MIRPHITKKNTTHLKIGVWKMHFPFKMVVWSLSGSTFIHCREGFPYNVGPGSSYKWSDIGPL